MSECQKKSPMNRTLKRKQVKNTKKWCKIIPNRNHINKWCKVDQNNCKQKQIINPR